MYSVSSLKDDLERKLHGTTVDKLRDFYGLAAEAARNVVARIDPKETRRVTNIENALYYSVNKYTVPTDLKGDKIIDIRPQTNREWWNYFTNVYSVDFDLYRTDQTFNVESDSGTKYLRASRDLPRGPVLSTLTDITSNGTWVAGSNASNLREDTLNTIVGNASLRFDISASGTTGYIENTGLTSIDLSLYEDIGALFLNIFLPDASNVTNVILRWGSSSSNYWSKTVTANADSTVFRDGWNGVRFDWSGATETGTPDSTAVDYVRITVTYNGTANANYRVNYLVVELGRIYEIVYYSKYLFKDEVTDAWKAAPTADADEINLDVDSYNLLLYEMALLAAQELQGEDSSFDVNYWENKKTEVWKDYMSNNKSEAIKRGETYYRMPGRRSSMRGYLGDLRQY